MSSKEIHYRENLFRDVQDLFRRPAPALLGYFYRKGLLNGTQTGNRLGVSDDLMPDDITMAKLELTVRAAKKITRDGVSWKAIGNAAFAESLDLFDGLMARLLDMASADGASKDAIADRMSELYIATHVAQTVSSYSHQEYPKKIPLMVAMQLSTLTKAASEMYGVPTKENGIGGMPERLRILLYALIDTGKLEHEQNTVNQQIVINRIDGHVQHIIDNSHFGAKIRIDRIAKHGRNNPNLTDEKSGAASEARKYANVIHMNTLLGIDIVGELNGLSRGTLCFPTLDMLQKYPYVTESMKSLDMFIRQSMAIAGFNVSRQGFEP